mmetsp:Transcript_40578/g.95283  ORF Transcript_40578/g.95283 Transcript_40578/m.95283 type:complete len:367 (-) Transcript_40578:1059-2159(-)
MLKKMSRSTPHISATEQPSQFPPLASGMTYEERYTSSRLAEEERFNFMTDQPVWRPNSDRDCWDMGPITFRDGPYRLLRHQDGTIGDFHIKILSCRSLRGSTGNTPTSSRVHFSLGGMSDDRRKRPQASTSSSTVDISTGDPKWHRESHSMPLRKGSFPDGCEVFLDVSVSERFRGGGLPLAGLRSDRIIGRGSTNLAGLLLGTTSEQINVWVPLQEDGGGDVGEVHLILSYIPHGLDPRADDIVCLESFARRSRVGNLDLFMFGPLEPMKVLACSGPYLHVRYRMMTGRAGTARIHRNVVFVIERINFVDGLCNFALLPADVVMGTDSGRRVARAVGPAVDYVGVCSQMLSVVVSLSNRSVVIEK